MSVATVIKDPQARLQYGFDWEKWLAGRTITATSWTVPTGLEGDTEAFSPSVATIWLSGGTVGKTYSVINQITASDGSIDERTFRLTIRNK